ncbi:GDSL-type esterase/lipase family protein [Streptococcus himalayensis]|uniref:Esterase n=1 Tax=Streptococcus himalayensis TaxID=1888195 RepID=A0A917A4W1_9STRE|nr:GDSL-type esterase/lipase family protein [Streptococcus himalayensis]GGE27671.1 esterase [Streptococcus himalayensis]
MKIQITGDSLAARYEGHGSPILNELLTKKCGELEIVNTAISGQNSQDLLDRKRLIQQAGGDFLFIFVGSNDLARHKPIDRATFSSNLYQLIDGLHEWVDEIVLVSPPPVDEQKQAFRDNDLIMSYVRVMEAVAKEKSCQLVNIFRMFSENEVPLAELMKGLADDGLHFGEVGYQLVTEAMLALINSRQSKENLV